ncbi:MAG TPA: hybrid sensor histidine kinase/response regulator, partial [Pyrinomonadaceae bacterium]|nr:hybrid sensor histidine kinase/response regulator [Pyrinomonadaceae bacterium]
RHEGSIEVESEVGRGTTFSIKLPAAKASSKAAPATAQEAQDGAERPKPSRRVRMLVVDDEPSVRELLRELLEAEGHAVELASNAFEALSMFRASKFDVIFTDIGMPGMSGWELARAVRSMDAEIPLAVITGWGDEVGSERQKDAGVDCVVTKPFTAERIVELVEELTGRLPERAANAPLPFSASSLNQEHFNQEPVIH